MSRVIELKNGEGKQGHQRQFEDLASLKLMVPASAFEIGATNRYLNSHVQWLWTQYRRGLGLL